MIPDEEIREAWEEARSIRGGARLVGLSKTGFRNRVNRLGLRDEADDRALQAGMDAVGTDITPRLVWAKTKPDEDGVAYSVLIKPEEKGPTDGAEQIREIMNGIERVDALPQIERCSSDLLGLIILSDIHVGMLAWGKETGVPYDTAEACRRIREWTSYAVATMPPCSRCVILFNGDTMHADDTTNQTPAHRHNLDVDSRLMRSIDMAIESIVVAIESALIKHGQIEVVVKQGNHDPHSYMPLVFGLSGRYHNEPRVNVNQEPSEYWSIEFGRTMITSHHGHNRRNPRDIAGDIADEWSEAWGRTKYRYLWISHAHAREAGEAGGIMWERTNATAERDAYASSRLYRGRANIKAVIYSSAAGEVERKVISNEVIQSRSPEETLGA